MYTLKVEKISCLGCAARITRAVQALDPNAEVEVLLGDRLLYVESAEAANEIAGAVTSAGYPASHVVKA